MQSNITLQAGFARRVDVLARNLVLLDIGAADTIDIAVSINGFQTEEVKGVRRGLTMKTPGFTGVTLTSAVDTVVQLLTTVADVDVNYLDGATVKALIQGTVPVSIAGTVNVVNDRGSPGNPVNVTAVTVADSPATSVTNLGTVAVSASATVLVAAAATRREVRFYNVGNQDVAIGNPTSLSFARRVIVLQPGDMWVETRAANLAWSGICNTGLTSNINVQEVFA